MAVPNGASMQVRNGELTEIAVLVIRPAFLRADVLDDIYLALDRETCPLILDEGIQDLYPKHDALPTR